MSLQAVVKGRDNSERPWKEAAHLISVSPTGSSFNLSRQCEVGTLVLLLVPLPAHMRCYDHDKDIYRVWGLVQHSARISADDKPEFHIGVAFIGKNAPASYKSDPQQHYRISGVHENGMWSVEESKTPFKKRSDVRFWQQVDLYLALIDTKHGSFGGERTVAENVSRSGAAVFSTLDVNIGDRVKFISAEYDFSGLAVVCDRQEGDDGRAKLHLKFVQAAFPVETFMKTNVMAEEV
ncbi:MAG TPA: hypothetical protein VFZ23_18415 [Pyrinomonadaceae bacterium]